MLRVTKMDPFENLREALVIFFEKDIFIKTELNAFTKSI